MVMLSVYISFLRYAPMCLLTLLSNLFLFRGFRHLYITAILCRTRESVKVNSDFPIDYIQAFLCAIGRIGRIRLQIPELHSDSQNHFQIGECIRARILARYFDRQKRLHRTGLSHYQLPKPHCYSLRCLQGAERSHPQIPELCSGGLNCT